MGKLTPQQITDYASLGLAAIQAGYQIFTAFKGLVKQSGMSDEDINAIEGAMVEEDRRLADVRRQMAVSD